MTEQELIVKDEYQVAAFSPFVAQLSELRETNLSLVFDYEDPKQNKAARSHVFQLRKTRAAIDRARKAEKEESLRYGRLVDDEAKAIMGEIEAMIAVHQEPLDKIDAREKARVDAITKRISVIANLADGTTVGTEESVATLKLMLADVEQLEVDETFGEFAAEAIGTRKRAIDYLKDRIEQRAKYEAEQEELARLRAEVEKRAQQERDERIAREAEERARQEAEERERQLVQEKLKAEQDARDAEERAMKTAKETEERLKREADEKAKAEAAEAERRENNRRIAARVNNAAARDIVAAAGVSEDVAKDIVRAIASGKVANVSIVY